MNDGPSSPPTAPHAELLALANELRPELHRYCARLMGSVIEGEDVVQDTFARAFVALDELKEDAPLRTAPNGERVAPGAAGTTQHAVRPGPSTAADSGHIGRCTARRR